MDNVLPPVSLHCDFKAHDELGVKTKARTTRGSWLALDLGNRKTAFLHSFRSQFGN